MVWGLEKAHCVIFTYISHVTVGLDYVGFFLLVFAADKKCIVRLTVQCVEFGLNFHHYRL